MENQDLYSDKEWKEMEKTHRRGKVLGGLLIVAIGSLYLARELGVVLPFWLLSWKMLLIGLGVVVAVKHKFLHPAWILLIGVGGIFLLGDLYPEMNIKPILWPLALIMVGLFIIFKPRRRYSEKIRHRLTKLHNRHHDHWHNYNRDWQSSENTDDDHVESTSCMAGVKKNIISKNFKGGEVVNIFGGTELNLMQADITDRAVLELTQVFGGTKLIVPVNWGVKSELVTVFGSVEDKRPNHTPLDGETSKMLVLTGVTFFGGIEIRSY